LDAADLVFAAEFLSRQILSVVNDVFNFCKLSSLMNVFASYFLLKFIRMILEGLEAY